MPLSEARVVKELLRQRIRVDRAYAMKLGACSLLESGGTSDIAEPVLCTYMDLDRLIENSGMTAEQRFVTDQTMQGWTETDIAEARGCSRQAVCRLLRDAVQRIVDANNAEWKRFAQRRLGGDGSASAKVKQIGNSC